VALDGVRVELRGGAETWPVEYRDGRWGIDYEGLAPDSVLRLDPAGVTSWRSDAAVREEALAWWLPMARPLPSGGTLWAQHAVGVAWHSVQQRWLVLSERPDGLAAGLFGLEIDGSLGARWAVPAWPDRVPRPVHRWSREWSAALSPTGGRLVLTAAGRFWLLELETSAIVRGPRGLLGTIVDATWSPDGRWLALGDARGNVGLVGADSPQPVAVRYHATSAELRRSAVAGMGFLPGGESLLVSWDDGRVRTLQLPDLAETELVQQVCCGAASDMVVDQSRGRALVACGGTCPPMAVSALPLFGGGLPERYADSALAAAGGIISVSPDGRWVILAAQQPGASAALCRAEDLSPVAAFSELPLSSVAWRDDSAALLALREDGSAVYWRVAEILKRAELAKPAQ